MGRQGPPSLLAEAPDGVDTVLARREPYVEVAVRVAAPFVGARDGEQQLSLRHAPRINVCLLCEDREETDLAHVAEDCRVGHYRDLHRKIASADAATAPTTIMVLAWLS